MGENTPQERDEDCVIRTLEDLAAALTERFLENADAGEHAANDEMIAQLADWRRSTR